MQNQVETCGHCHQAALTEYRTSVHGQGLDKAGLVKTAVCANCHGAHGILKAENPASRLHTTQVADTCGACHRFIEDRLKLSVHGAGTGRAGPRRIRLRAVRSTANRVVLTATSDTTCPIRVRPSFAIGNRTVAGPATRICMRGTA